MAEKKIDTKYIPQRKQLAMGLKPNTGGSNAKAPKPKS